MKIIPLLWASSILVALLAGYFWGSYTCEPEVEYLDKIVYFNQTVEKNCPTYTHYIIREKDVTAVKTKTTDDYHTITTKDSFQQNTTYYDADGDAVKVRVCSGLHPNKRLCHYVKL